MRMSREKRGGARLEHSGAPKKNAQDPKPQETGKGRAAQGKLSRGAKIAIIVVVSILALLLILFAVYKSWAKLPDLPDLPEQDITADPITGEMPSGAPENAARKKEFYTFLVVGRDTGGGGNTDTLMLAAYDVPNQKLTVMSIPRDTMVDARHPGSNKKINAVWNLGLHYAEKGSEKKGIDYLKEAVGDMTGITPDFHVIVNWEAFGRLVDAIGGVDFEVPFEMQYKDPTQDLVIDQAAGMRHLSGDDAMQVVRWRHNNSYSVQYADADLGRIRTQQALMKEIVKKCLKIENVTKINQFAEIFTEEVETDLSLGNLVAFAERAIFGGLNMDNVNFVTMPVTGVYVNKASYVQAKPEELLGILNDGFNPYTEDLTADRMKVLQYSASSGYYIYKGTGTGVKPTYTTPKPAQAVTKPSATAKPSDTPDDTPQPSQTPDASASRAPESAPPSAPSQEDPSETPERVDNTPEPTPEQPSEGVTPRPVVPPPMPSDETPPTAGLGIPLD